MEVLKSLENSYLGRRCVARTDIFEGQSSNGILISAFMCQMRGEVAGNVRFRECALQAS